MKRLLGIAFVGLVGLTSGNATPRPNESNVRFVTVQYPGVDVPAVAIAAIYNINGVNYPVDYNRRIWGRNAYGAWVVIGRIESTLYGDFAVSPIGRYPATRVE